MKLLYTPDQAKSRLSKFQDRPWREHQREAVDFCMNSTKRFRILEAPTGAGKSMIGMVCAMMAGVGNYLCGTKLLQTQIISDFPEAKSLWGRNNYPCLLNSEKTCDQCSATKANPCDLAGQCIYPLTKKTVLGSPLRILNYAYYLSEVQYAGRFSGSPLTIIDEADSLENTLVNHISLSFTERSLFRLGLEQGPSKKTITSQGGIDSWKEFGKEALNRSQSLYQKLSIEIDKFARIEEDWQFQKLRERDYFIHLSERCQMFLDNVDSTWLMENIERQGSRQAETIFRPLWITPDLAEEFLWQHSPNFILMSASFLPLPVLCKTLGIDISEVDYMALPSTFPVENRPVHIWPVANMTAKTTDTELPKLLRGIEKVLKRHPLEKGIIHCTSYKLAKSIVEGVGSNRLITHNSKDRQEVVDKFTSTPGNLVLVSPSLERGVNLADDLCRFVIVAKAPYLSLGDKVVSQRVYGAGDIGKTWYASDMMLSVLQGCGRGMRSKTDTCICYLIDQQIEKAYISKPLIWPDWFKAALDPWEENELLDSDEPD